MLFSYDYPETVRDILQDAKPLDTSRHGNSQDGHMTLFQGAAGRLIVQIRQDRETPVPEVRILNVPENISNADAVRYARMHQAGFTPWQNMLCLSK